MPETPAQEYARLHRRLIDLETVEDHEADLDRIRENLQEVKRVLDKSSSDAASAKEKIGDIKDAVGKLDEALGSTKGFLSDAAGALGEVEEGVGKFGDQAGAVGEKIGKLDDILAKLDQLRDLSDADPADMLRGLADQLDAANDLLGGLPDDLPGFGAFMQIWTDGIRGIAVSADQIQKIVDRNNRIMQQVYGKDLYRHVLTDREKRREEIARIKARLAELDYTPPAPAGDGDDLQWEYAQFAIANGLERLGMTREQLEEAAGRLARARARLRAALSRTQVLEGEALNIGGDIAAAEATIATAGNDIARAEKARAAQAELKMLEARQARLPHDLATARADLEAANREYVAARKAMEHPSQVIHGLLPGDSDYRAKEHLERYDPDTGFETRTYPEVERALQRAAQAGSPASTTTPVQTALRATRPARPILGAAFGALTGLGVAVVVQQAGMWPLDRLALFGIPGILALAGLLLCRLGKAGRAAPTTVAALLVAALLAFAATGLGGLGNGVIHGGCTVQAQSNLDTTVVTDTSRLAPFDVDPAGSVSWTATSPAPITDHTWNIWVDVGGFRVTVADGGDPNTAKVVESQGSKEVSGYADTLRQATGLSSLEGIYRVGGSITGTGGACDGFGFVRLSSGGVPTGPLALGGAGLAILGLVLLGLSCRRRAKASEPTGDGWV